jgi:TonB family protein
MLKSRLYRKLLVKYARVSRKHHSVIYLTVPMFILLYHAVVSALGILIFVWATDPNFNLFEFLGFKEKTFHYEMPLAQMPQIVMVDIPSRQGVEARQEVRPMIKKKSHAIVPQYEIVDDKTPETVVDTSTKIENNIPIDLAQRMDSLGGDGEDSIFYGDFSGDEMGSGTSIGLEQMPSFEGNDRQAFREYVVKNLHYPESAVKRKVKGLLYLQFAINSKGFVEDVKVLKSIDPELDREAMRVIARSPKWTPARQRGKPVKVIFKFPIAFVL